MSTRKPILRERRRGDRSRVSRDVPMREGGDGVQVTLREIGPLSFAIESPVPFRVGTTHEFLVGTAGSDHITITGLTKRCVKAIGASGDPRYSVGLAIVDRTPSDRARRASFIHALIAAGAVRSQR